MMEYTILVVTALVICIILDKVLKTGILKLNRKVIFFFVFFSIFFYIIEIFAINRGWWFINPAYTSKIMIGFNIPLEEYLFLLFWIFVALIPWQYFKKHLKD